MILVTSLARRALPAVWSAHSANHRPPVILSDFKEAWCELDTFSIPYDFQQDSSLPKEVRVCISHCVCGRSFMVSCGHLAADLGQHFLPLYCCITSYVTLLSPAFSRTLLLFQLSVYSCVDLRYRATSFLSLALTLISLSHAVLQ